MEKKLLAHDVSIIINIKFKVREEKKSQYFMRQFYSTRNKSAGEKKILNLCREYSFKLISERIL